MRPPPMVSNPYPTQSRPWVHRCHKHGCRMLPNRDNGGIHCPVCLPTVSSPRVEGVDSLPAEDRHDHPDPHDRDEDRDQDDHPVDGSWLPAAPLAEVR